MANRVQVEVSANVQGFTQGMNEASQSAQQYETDMRRVSESTVNFRKEFMKAKRNVQDLAASYAQLDNATKQSTFGREMKRQLDEAKAAAAEFVDMQGDLQLELKNLASDTHTFDMMADSIGLMADITSTAMGVMAQFTGNEEDARRAVVAFTTAQSFLSTATKIQNALQSQSNVMKAVGKVQDLAAAAASRVKAAAEGKGAIATKAATVAQAAFNKVAMANPYVILAMAIIGVVGAIGTFIALTRDSSKAEEEAQKKIEETNKKLDEQRDALINTSGQMYNTASRLEHLYAAYKQSNSEIEKTNILTEAAGEFKKLGIEVNGVKDAQTILVNQGQQVIELIKLQGDAAAIAAMRFEAFKQSMKTMLENGYTVSQARLLAGYNKEVQEFDKELDKINNKTAQLKKNLNIKTDVFKQATKAKTTAKVELKVEEGSLQALKNQLSKLEEKKIKLNLSGEKLKQLQKEIDNKKKEIEDKEIELGIKAKRGSLEDITNKISDIENKIKKLDPKIDEAKIRKLQIDKQALEEAKKEIEDKFKEVEIKGTLFKSDADKGSEQWQSDKVSYLRQKVRVTSVDDSRYQEWLQRYKEEKKKLEQLEIKVEADLDDTTKGSLEWLGKQKQKYEAILETSVVGSKEWDNALKNINKLTKEEQKIQMKIEVSGMSDLEKTFKLFEGFHAIDDVVNSFSSLTSAIEDDADAWTIFMAAISTVESVMSAINTVTEIANMLSAISAGAKIAEASASGAATTAAGTEAAAESAAVAPATAATAANRALEASYLDLASAMIFAAHASIPFVGVGLASGFIATMLSLQAAVKAETLAMMTFAEGGIVGGSSYNGDKIIARVNSGEMILNQRQQKNLFDLLDGDVMPQKGGTNVRVSGVVRGSDLILVQKNTNKIKSKAGVQINF